MTAIDSLRDLLEKLPDVIDAYINVLSLMFVPLTSFIQDNPIQILPGWLLAVLRNILEKYTAVGNLSLFTLMFSTGLVVFLVATLIKWLIGIIT